MNSNLILFIQFLYYNFAFFSVNAQYEANWDSLDTRPLPDWYDKAKIGIFLHWGVYSVPSYGSAWFWYSWLVDQSPGHIQFMKDNYPPDYTYQDFAKDFTAEFYDPAQWAALFKNAGAQYVVLTSKHHEGYALWPSKYSYSWNAGDVGPHRDLLGDLSDAVRAQGLHFGLYHSLLEWFHPLYLEDKANNWTTRTFPETKAIPELTDLINIYKPDVLWSDGDWEAPDSYWNSVEFLAWLYNESPVKDIVVTNDRWGDQISCHHGDFYSCADRYNPGTLQLHKWENAMTVDREAWGYRRQLLSTDVLSTHDLIATIAQTISCGGNILINVGPTKEGTIIPIFQERLQNIGWWLSVNGEAIYESVPWTVQNDTLTSGIWYTSKNAAVYAIVLNWPSDNILSLGSALALFEPSTAQVTLLGNEELGNLEWQRSEDKIDIQFPNKVIVNSKWAWILKILSQ